MTGRKLTIDMSIEEYARHMEQRNGELFEFSQHQRSEIVKYRTILIGIMRYCKGCPASDIAAETLGELSHEEEENAS